MSTACDIIGGFKRADPNCYGCAQPLELKNAWMADGCPCNTRLGVNSMNETRWRLLMQLQQKDSRDRESLEAALRKIEEMTWGGKGESAVHLIASAALNRNPKP